MISSDFPTHHQHCGIGLVSVLAFFHELKRADKSGLRYCGARLRAGGFVPRNCGISDLR